MKPLEYEADPVIIQKLFRARSLLTEYYDLIKEIEASLTNEIGATFAYRPDYVGEQFGYSNSLYRNIYKTGEPAVSETFQEQEANMVRVEITLDGKIKVTKGR